MQNQTYPLVLTFGLTDPVGAIGIQADLAARLHIAPERLALAQKFDQVINALVNYLLKTALNETLGTLRK